MIENLNYSIRPAKVDDAKKLTELVTRGLPGYPFESVYNHLQVADAIAQGEHRLVAEGLHGQIIATAVLGVNSEPLAEVKRVVVDPEYRQNGLAKAITSILVDDCHQLGKIPWADARADQIGMQRAAINGGLIPISVESGKHIVYQHLYSGPARESMVHMTEINLNPEILIQNLATWPEKARHLLINNLKDALQPKEKNEEIARIIIPSAQKTKEKIRYQITQLPQVKTEIINDDIQLLNINQSQLLVILPDASGFINNIYPSDISHLIKLSREIGLQIITYYCPISDIKTSACLFEAGLEPAMIRPWQKDNKNNPSWEIGWRKTMNHYKQCLHGINLAPEVELQIKAVIKQLL